MTDQNELAIIATSMTSLNALAKVNKLLVEAHKLCLSIVASDDLELLDNHFPFPNGAEAGAAVARIAEEIQRINDLRVLSWTPTFEKLAHLRKGADLVGNAKNNSKVIVDEATRNTA